ncbi:MAG TPA: hypothetical protein VIG50_13010 [Vicinamibacteria bacterium]
MAWRQTWLGAVLALAATLGTAQSRAGAASAETRAADVAVAGGSAEDGAIRKVIADYGRAIETRDLELFKVVKPNLTQDEERRTRAAFDAVKSQVVKITVLSVDVDGDAAVVRVSRRDTINGSLVSSFPQTFRLARGKAGWGIQEIGK